MLQRLLHGYKTEKRILCYSVLFRVAVYLLAIAHLSVMSNETEWLGYDHFLRTWTRWDAHHYINLAENGYAGAVEDGNHLFLVFYPLLPWVLRTMHLVIDDYRLCGIILNLICFSIGNLYFYLLAKDTFGEKAGKNAVLFLAIFPFGFFFGSVMTESLFLMLSAMFLYYLRKHKWWRVALIGFLACLTKVQGCCLAFAVAAELLWTCGGFRMLFSGRFKEFGRKIAVPALISSLMVFGFLIYLGINYAVEGDPFRFMYYQRTHWYHTFVPLWRTLTDYVVRALTYTSLSMRFCVWIPGLIVFVLWMVSIVYGMVRKMPSAFVVYMVALWVVTFSTNWILSGGRYALCALPCFMLLGDWLTRHEKWRIPLAAVSSMLFIIYMTGYFLGKQVM
jgi:hypothetical protein